jgi:hypothetical protein
MKQNFLIAFLATMLITLVLIDPIFGILNTSPDSPEFFVGIDVAFYNLDEMYDLIDEVSYYTNLFIIGTTEISSNESRIIEVCQYLSDLDMYFIIHAPGSRRLQLISEIETRYGDHFLGIYYDDEQGGKQLDMNDYRWVYDAKDQADAANQFVQGLKWWLNRKLFLNGTFTPAPSDFPLFSSDYALYWFDYEAGYDALFAEFGWNYSRQLNIALCRGAATVQNKEWGAMVAWSYNRLPYIESGPELYNDLVFAYENGAKYLVVFNSNEDYTHGILQKEHLEALKQFWNYVNNNPRTGEALAERVAYVLPKDYGYGFRDRDEKIWGLWEADSFSYETSVNLESLLEEHGTNLDVIYDDPQFSYEEIYSEIYFAETTTTHSNISCEVSSSSITIGDSITVSGLISPATLVNVTIQISADNGTTWEFLTSLSSGSDGNYSYTWKPSSVGSYEFKASFEGESFLSEAKSDIFFVTFPLIPSLVSYSVSPPSITEGDSVRVSGVVDIAVLGKTLIFAIEKPDGLVLYRTVTTDSAGSFIDSFVPDLVGNWTLTVLGNENSTLVGRSGMKKSFEVLKHDPFSMLPQWLMPTLEIIIPAIVIMAVAAWLITRPPKPSITTSVVKAHLLNLGDGELEFIDNTLRFHWEKGRFRKMRKIVREISMSDIESMNRNENELSITWKGVTDLFIIDDGDLAGSIFEMIPQTSIEQRKLFEEKELAKQKWNEFVIFLPVAIETIDSLFDILRSLHDWVDWNRVENLLKESIKKAQELTDQKINLIELDFSKLTTAIKAHILEETSKEAYRILRYLHDYFSGLNISNLSLGNIRPNFHDGKSTIVAYYLLNDIMLGMIVGDSVEKEVNSLMVMLEDLSKSTSLRISIDDLKKINEVGVDQEKDRIIRENRALFKKQLTNFKKIETRKLIKSPIPLVKHPFLLRAKNFLKLVGTSLFKHLQIFCVKARNRMRKRR